MATNYAVSEPTTTAASADTTTRAPLTPLTLLQYLAGSRRAILQLAESRSALWLGLSFVLSAGFAREYDGTDLLHEPWHLVLPLGASLVTSFVLYCLVFLATRNRGVQEFKFAAGYRTLLTFYWWTAPLAWIYAIPVERFLSPGDATAANLWFLAAVSVWRVLLMTRALSVWLGANFVGMFFIVMLFADSVALVLTAIAPQPIFNVMGGIRHSQADSAVLGAMLTTTFFGGLSWLLWLFGACVVIFSRKPNWTLSNVGWKSGVQISKSLWIGGLILIGVGFALLPLGQPEQQRRSHAEQLLRSDQLDDAVKYISRFSREDFPPVWDPPPRVGYGEETPSPLEVLSVAERHQSPEWVRAFYIEKLSQNPHRAFQIAFRHDGEVDTSAFDRVLSAFEKYVPPES
ncbi:MAG TPA: hypothetical protein VHK01_02795, partial [Lacipirellulaceae bacterium]|nr:hypothetical protein [Lacipirellulaceae bacterium]